MGITGLFNAFNANFTCMSITLPEDKKKAIDKEIKAVEAKLEVVGRFKSAVGQIEEFCTALVNFDNSLKAINEWMAKATEELKDIKEASGSMGPEDRVARTMDLQEDIASKLEVLKKNARLRRLFCPRETRFLLMPRPTRMSLPGSPSMSLTWLRTGLASRSSLPGWWVLREPLLRVSPSLPALMRSRLCMRRFTTLRRPLTTT